jgi:hypothetical protein
MKKTENVNLLILGSRTDSVNHSAQAQFDGEELESANSNTM